MLTAKDLEEGLKQAEELIDKLDDLFNGKSMAAIMFSIGSTIGHALKAVEKEQKLDAVLEMIKAAALIEMRDTDDDEEEEPVHALN
jgi:hypothetical protein